MLKMLELKGLFWGEIKNQGSFRLKKDCFLGFRFVAKKEPPRKTVPLTTQKPLVF